MTTNDVSDTRISDERLAEMHNATCDRMVRGFDDAFNEFTAQEAYNLVTELQSLRALQALDREGVRPDPSYRSPREDAAYFGSIWSLSTNQMVELEKTFEYHRDHRPSFGGDYPKDVLSSVECNTNDLSIKTGHFADPLAGRGKSATLSQPQEQRQEAVAWQARKDSWPEGYWSNPTQLSHSPVVDFGEGWHTRLLYAAPQPAPVEAGVHAPPDVDNRPFCDCHQEYGEGLIEALEWYEEQARNCRKLHGIPEGEAARAALSADGGKRARAALSVNPQNGEK